MGRKHYYMFSLHPFYFKEVKTTMTIKDCIDIVDSLKPNQYTMKEKVMWLSFIEEIIINDVLKTHEGYDGRYDLFEGYSEDKLSVTLIVQSPYDRLYTAYLKMKIDEENGEVNRYNNSMVMFNSYMSEYRKHYNKTHMPLSVYDRSKLMPPNRVSSGLSDAEYENLKRDMTYILTEYFSKEVSPDKLYDIVKSYIQNNIDLFKDKKTDVSAPSYAFINILGGASNWTAEDVTDITGNLVGVRYGQRVNVNNAVITKRSKVDLQITSEQMVIFYKKDIAFVTENDGGVVTVYCVGQIPENDYKIQAIVTEVSV